MTRDIPGVAILGPTASGKTRLALSLAARFRGEIVSCDALQVYRQMDIGTAKVSKAGQQQVRHHLIDIMDPDQEFSAGDYQRLARTAIREIHKRGNVPVVAGGTGFYLRALIEGLFEGPGRSDELRSRMRAVIRRKGPGVLHRALKRADPPAAQRISPNDAERIIRAYEVYLVSGKTMTWWQNRPRDAFTGYRWLKIGIDLPREELYRRINERVDAMFAGGLLEETAALLTSFSRDAHAFKAIGYRQAIDLLEGRLSLEEAVEQTKLESRHYAKRQITWFRSDKSIVWLDGRMSPEQIESAAAARVADWLAG